MNTSSTNNTPEQDEQPRQTSEPGSDNRDQRNSHWMRLLYLLLFGLAFQIVEPVIFLLAIVSFLFLIFMGSTPQQAVSFGASLATYVKEIILFLTFNREQAPWPFDSWPQK